MQPYVAFKCNLLSTNRFIKGFPTIDLVLDTSTRNPSRKKNLNFAGNLKTSRPFELTFSQVLLMQNTHSPARSTLDWHQSQR